MKTIASLMKDGGMKGAVGLYADALKMKHVSLTQPMAEYRSIAAASFMDSVCKQHAKIMKALDEQKNTQRLIEQHRSFMRCPDNINILQNILHKQITVKSLVSQMAEYRSITAEQAKRFMFDDRIAAASLMKGGAIHQWTEALDGRKSILSLSEQHASLTRLPVASVAESLRGQRTISPEAIKQSPHQEQHQPSETTEITVTLPPIIQALVHQQPPVPRTKLPTPQRPRSRNRQTTTQPAADPSDRQAIISAYMSEIGRKGNQSYGATKRQIIEHFIQEHRESGISKNQFAGKYHKHYNRSYSTVRDILKEVRV